MKKFTNPFVKKEAKKSTQIIIYGVIALIICFVFLILGGSTDSKAEKEMLNMHELILKKEERAGKMSYLNAASKPYQFAVKEGTTNSYYFVSDGEYLYVVYMGLGDAATLRKEDIAEKPVKIQGVSKEVTKDIKEIAIDVYNEGLEDAEKLTLADYENYFGDIYLDLTSTADSDAGFQYTIGFISGFTGIILIIVGLCQKAIFAHSIKKLDNELIEKLDNEMNDKDAFYYNRARLFLTKNYVINFNGKIKAFKYSDILWMYTFEQRVNGIRASKALKVTTNDGKNHFIASVDAVTKKSSDVFQEIWETIASKNKDMLLGYTKENIKKTKEKVKEIKANR